MVARKLVFGFMIVAVIAFLGWYGYYSQKTIQNESSSDITIPDNGSQSVCDYESQLDTNYVFKDLAVCEVKEFRCPREGFDDPTFTEPFRDKCGCGCRQVGSAFIEEESAIEIAQAAIAGKVEHGIDEPITVELLGGNYIVTFVNVLPPGMLGADYAARVTIDAKTGMVEKILAGS